MKNWGRYYTKIDSISTIYLFSILYVYYILVRVSRIELLLLGWKPTVLTIKLNPQMVEIHRIELWLLHCKCSVLPTELYPLILHYIIYVIST